MVRRWQKGASVVLHAAVIERRVDGHETRQVVVFASQSIADPRSHAGHWHGGQPTVHRQCCLTMADVIINHRPDNHQIVDHVAQVRKQLADVQTAAAVAAKAEWRSVQKERTAPPVDGLAVIGLQPRLVIKRVDVRQSARQVDNDQVPGSGRKMRRPRCQRMAAFLPRRLHKLCSQNRRAAYDGRRTADRGT